MIKMVYLNESTIEENWILDWHVTGLVDIEVSHLAKLNFKLKLIELESSSSKTVNLKWPHPELW